MQKEKNLKINSNNSSLDIPLKIENLKSINLSETLPRHISKKYKLRNKSKINRIVVHCTDRDWSVTQLAEYDTKGKLSYNRKVDNAYITDINHINSKGIPAITYHDCITNLSVIHTLPYEEASYHAAGYNSKSIAIAMVYRTTDPVTNKAKFPPPENMLRLTECHVAKLCLKFGLSPDRVFGHRELKGTGWDWIRGRKRLLKSCPGPHVNLGNLRINAAKYMQIDLKAKKFYEGKIDGDFGNQSKLALKKYKNV